MLPSETNFVPTVNRHGTRGHGPFVLNLLPESYLALSKAELRHIPTLLRRVLVHAHHAREGELETDEASSRSYCAQLSI